MQKHIEAIRSIFCLADRRDIALWLESGWAIDARLGKITREHEDIDIAFPSERQQDYLALLYSLGFGDYQEMDYGFLMSQDGILLDCEPCRVVEGEYVVEGFPKGHALWRKKGKSMVFPSAACPGTQCTSSFLATWMTFQERSGETETL